MMDELARHDESIWWLNQLRQKARAIALVREYEDHCPCESVEQPERCERCLKADASLKKARA